MKFLTKPLFWGTVTSTDPNWIESLGKTGYNFVCYWKLLWGLKHDIGEGDAKETVKH